jgi:hypothetical protein
MPKLQTAVIVLSLAALLAFAACGDDETDTNGDGVTPTATQEEATATPTTTPPPPTETPPDIRSIDPAEIAQVSDFLAERGGEVASGQVLYADLSNDGREDIVVPIALGGEGGNFAVFVFGYQEGQLQQFLFAEPDQIRGGITADVQDGMLVTTEGSFAPNDPLCCPSELVKTFYRWDGESLVVDHEEREPAQ